MWILFEDGSGTGKYDLSSFWGKRYKTSISDSSGTNRCCKRQGCRILEKRKAILAIVWNACADQKSRREGGWMERSSFTVSKMAPTSSPDGDSTAAAKEEEI